MSEKEVRVNTLRIKAKKLIIEPEQVEIRRPSEVELEEEVEPEEE